jgi:hypothetical protein
MMLLLVVVMMLVMLVRFLASVRSPLVRVLVSIIEATITIVAPYRTSLTVAVIVTPTATTTTTVPCPTSLAAVQTNVTEGVGEHRRLRIERLLLRLLHGHGTSRRNHAWRHWNRHSHHGQHTPCRHQVTPQEVTRNIWW